MIIHHFLRLISLWKIWSDWLAPCAVFSIETVYNYNNWWLSGYHNHMLIMYRELLLKNVQFERFHFMYRLLLINYSYQVLSNFLSPENTVSWLSYFPSQPIYELVGCLTFTFSISGEKMHDLLLIGMWQSTFLLDSLIMCHKYVLYKL